MAKTNWLKQYRKSKEPLVDISVIAGQMSNVVANVGGTPAQYLNAIRNCDTQANGMAVMHKSLISIDGEEWKLSKNWFRMMLIQIMFDGLNEDPYERDICSNNIKGKYVEFKREPDDWIDKSKFLYSQLDWDYKASLAPKADDKREVIELFYMSNDKNPKPQYFKVVLEPMSVFTAGTKWISSTGKEWEFIEVVDKRYYFKDKKGRRIQIGYFSALGMERL